MENKNKFKLQKVITKNIDKGGFLHIENKAEDGGINLKPLEEEEDDIVNEVIDEIWSNYNDDGNDLLDLEEFVKFIYVTLIETGMRQFKSIAELRKDPNF